MAIRFTTETVWVTNKNRMKFTDRFDGVEYVFAPNVPEEVPALVAGHFFGHRDKDGNLPESEKTRAMSRNSWNLDRKNGEATFANFVITKEEPKALKAG